MLDEKEIQILEDYFAQQSNRIYETKTEIVSEEVKSYGYKNHLLTESFKMRELLLILNQPWDKYIPILHKSFMLLNVNDSNKKMIDTTTEIIKIMSYMSHSLRLISDMTTYYSQQIADLEMLTAEENKRTL